MVKEVFGVKPEMFTIKLGCRQACQIPNLQQEIILTVKVICDITFKGLLLANRHVVQCMEEDGFVDDVFNQTFFLIYMKFAANKDLKCPPDMNGKTFERLQ